jgi:HEAT repeat protein
MADAMNEAGPVAALIAGLDDAQKTNIRAAVDALIAVTTQEPVAREAVEQALAAGQHNNIWALAYVLGHLAQPSRATVRALLAGLDHQEPDIRWAIALLLVRMASAEPSIVALLVELCRSGTSNQRRMAVYCIRDLRLKDENSLQALLSASGDVEPAVRVAAVTSLRTRNNPGAGPRQRLLELFLTDPDFRVGNAAAVSLAQLGSPSEEFVTALRAAAGSEHAMRRKAAVAALSLLKSERPAPSDGSRSR